MKNLLSVWWWPVYVLPIYAYTRDGPKSRIYQLFQYSAAGLAIASALGLLFGHSKYTSNMLAAFAITYAINAIGGMKLYQKKVLKSLQITEWINLGIHVIFYLGLTDN
jgi:hypothetical protein